MRFESVYDAAEAEVHAQLAHELTGPLALATRLLRNGERLLDDGARKIEKSPASLVLATMVQRLMNDLRACTKLAPFGYVLQTLTLVAGMLELGNATWFIGDDAARAHRWRMHNSPGARIPR